MKFSRLSHLGPRDMFIQCLVCRNMPGQCLDHVGALFSQYFLSMSLEFWKFLRLSHLGIQEIFLVYLNFGPCKDHICPSSTPRVITALIFSRLSQLSTRNKLIKSLFLGPCQNPVWTILGNFLVKPHFQASSLWVNLVSSGNRNRKLNLPVSVYNITWYSLS